MDYLCGSDLLKWWLSLFLARQPDYTAAHSRSYYALWYLKYSFWHSCKKECLENLNIKKQTPN
jgi:hypothetical protein